MKESVIKIVGIEVRLLPLAMKGFKGITIGSLVSFEFYKGNFRGEEYCFIRPREGMQYTPSHYAWHTQRISEAMKMPVVLIVDKTDYNFRMRLIYHGVYFVAAPRFVFMPGILANALSPSKKKRMEQLSPKGQFILLYWLQETVLSQNVTISTFVGKWGFSYVSVTRALAELERYGICESRKEDDNSKTYILKKDKQTTWREYQRLLRNPVLKVVYSDTPIEGTYRITNISALSHYSMLNPDRYDSIAVLDSDFRKAKWKNLTNEIEGNYRIEVWCYEPAMFPDKRFVDKLSLVLSLQDDHDPRVEGEVERVLNEMTW